MSFPDPAPGCLDPHSCGLLGPTSEKCYVCSEKEREAEWAQLSPRMQTWVRLHRKYPWLGLYSGYPTLVSLPPHGRKDRDAAYQLVVNLLDDDLRGAVLAALAEDLAEFTRAIVADALQRRIAS